MKKNKKPATTLSQVRLALRRANAELGNAANLEASLHRIQVLEDWVADLKAAERLAKGGRL